MDAPARTLNDRVKRLRRELPPNNRVKRLRRKRSAVIAPKRPRSSMTLPNERDVAWNDDKVRVSGRNYSAEVKYEYLRYQHDWSKFVFDGFKGTDVRTSVTGNGEDIDLCVRKERVTLDVDRIEIPGHPDGCIQVELDFEDCAVRVYKKVTGIEGMKIAAVVQIDPDHGVSKYSRPSPLKY